jgi:hypothetical protein
MAIGPLLQKQGWQLVPRDQWIAVKDPRPAFRTAFRTDRVGKIVGSHFYITLAHQPALSLGLIRLSGGVPRFIGSTSGDPRIAYCGFDTAELSEEALKVFVRRLADMLSWVLVD